MDNLAILADKPAFHRIRINLPRCYAFEVGDLLNKIIRMDKKPARHLQQLAPVVAENLAKFVVDLQKFIAG